MLYRCHSQEVRDREVRLLNANDALGSISGAQLVCRKVDLIHGLELRGLTDLLQLLIRSIVDDTGQNSQLAALNLSDALLRCSRPCEGSCEIAILAD